MMINDKVGMLWLNFVTSLRLCLHKEAKEAHGAFVRHKNRNDWLTNDESHEGTTSGILEHFFRSWKTPSDEKKINLVNS